MTRSNVPTDPIEQPLAIGILAGGAGRRWGGRDKGWVEVDGMPQIVRTIERFRGCSEQLVVSANRSLGRYRALGVEVVSDPWPDYPGPLAGVACLLAAARGRLLLTVPVDLERWPDGLLPRMLAVARHGTVAVAADDDGTQPLVACYPARLSDSAKAAFEAGERSVRRWQAQLQPTLVATSDFRFGNRNHPPAPVGRP